VSRRGHARVIGAVAIRVRAGGDDRPAS
jgi:hypothetical protein